MFAVLFVNLLINLYTMFVLQMCEKQPKCADRTFSWTNSSESKYGALYNTAPLFSILIYSLPFFCYFPLFKGMFKMFKLTYVDIYRLLKCRLSLYFLLLQSIILFRVLVYISINYKLYSNEMHLIGVYIIEILNGIIIVIISYKNL